MQKKNAEKLTVQLLQLLCRLSCHCGVWKTCSGVKEEAEGMQLGGRGKIFAGDKIPPLNDGAFKASPHHLPSAYTSKISSKKTFGLFLHFENLSGQVLHTFQSDLPTYWISYATSWLSPSGLVLTPLPLLLTC